MASKLSDQIKLDVELKIFLTTRFLNQKPAQGLSDSI